jgi:hypothetical protein
VDGREQEMLWPPESDVDQAAELGASSQLGRKNAGGLHALKKSC